MSLTITRADDETLVLVSDDKHAENAALTEAIDASAPHLLEAWDATTTSADGRLRFPVARADWGSLSDVLEELSCGMDVDPEELAAVEKVVNAALDE